ncbi:MAG: reactive intermediate/imine deaminase [Candidatus Dojkabacteria bacterium]|nr:MAG: reactive intermediate/imine deaminase [Candidatus Dojkabacteria bacterium]
MKKEIKTQLAPQAIGPYSQAVEYGNLIFCSGQIGINYQTGDLISDDIQLQTQQVITNIRNILEAAGSALDKVLQMQVFLVNLDDFVLFNEVYAQYFDAGVKPARFTVVVSSLPKNAKIEIACIAYK